MKHLKVLIYLLCICASPSLLAEETLDLDGMSIIGNRELPKALFIVPWKNPEAALAPDRPVNSLVNNTLQPVDPDVFRRKLQYFDTVHKNSSSYTAETP